MQDSETIAILIRHADQLPAALRTSQRFCLAGMKVAIFVIGSCLQAATADGCRELACQLPDNAECYSDHPADARRFGFETISLPRMAEKIAVADRVIPY